MKIISHRGNINGINKNLENKPSHIISVLNKFDVEVDVWFIDNKWFLGHDNPQYEVLFSFFKENMWIHCKNLQACEQLLKTNLNWFWHENDKFVLTSKKILWCNLNVYMPNGITVELKYNNNLPKYILGICTDEPDKYHG
jgi:hypothetical protein